VWSDQSSSLFMAASVVVLQASRPVSLSNTLIITVSKTLNFFERSSMVTDICVSNFFGHRDSAKSTRSGRGKNFRRICGWWGVSEALDTNCNDTRYLESKIRGGLARVREEQSWEGRVREEMFLD